MRSGQTFYRQDQASEGKGIGETTRKSELMKIAIVCVEDGLASVGVRKMASLIRSLNKDTMLYYVPYKNSRSLYEAWRGTHGDSDDVSEDIVREIAEALGDADIVGFSSMTSYSDLTKEIIAQIRKVNPKTYIIWGGIHPIIVPEDAIMHADAIDSQVFCLI